jgi:hypothetical protein
MSPWRIGQLTLVSLSVSPCRRNAWCHERFRSRLAIFTFHLFFPLFRVNNVHLSIPNSISLVSRGHIHITGPNIGDTIDFDVGYLKVSDFPIFPTLP